MSLNYLCSILNSSNSQFKQVVDESIASRPIGRFPSALSTDSNLLNFEIPGESWEIRAVNLSSI